MAKITVEGEQYTVVDKGSYNHDIGHYWKRVLVDGKEKVVVGRPGFWRFWTAKDRTEPMRNLKQKLVSNS